MIRIKKTDIDVGKVLNSLNINKAKEKLLTRLKEATPVDTGEARDGWRTTSSGIVNDVEHISELNAGSSQQAPAFFIEKVVLTEDGVKANGSIVQYKTPH